MAGLWLANVAVHDEALYRTYAEKAGGVLAAHGATFLARGGRYQQMEGPDRPRNVVVRFDTFEAALACYESDEYQEIAKTAIAASERSIVIVETDD